jgi:hypothetical protein
MTDVTARNRLTLLLIGGLPVTMILLASWLWYYVSRGEIDLVGLLGTANNGQLLDPPLPLQDVELRDARGERVELFPADNSLWRILIPGAVRCDEACKEQLVYTRQIKIAMGKYCPRFERLYLGAVAVTAQELGQNMAEEHPGLKILYTPGPAELWDTLVPATDAPAYFLVDPRGWIMMSYPAGGDGKAVMADLKFLLKNSSD